VGPAIEAAYVKTVLADASMNASDILVQNAMINHFADTGQVMSSASSDPAAVLLSMAKSQATAQANASYMLQARMADEASPVVRNVIEILLLGAFPIVCVMLLVTEGRRTLIFIVGYLYALVWVELWPFTYAILNYVHTVYTAKEVAASAFVNPGSALTLMTSGIVYSTALSTSAIAGWMTLAVPTLSAALLWGFDKIVGAVPSLSSMLSGAGPAAANAAVGSIAQGNVSFNQQTLSPQRSSAFFSSAQDDLRGDTRIFGMSGVACERLQNDTYFSGAIQAHQAMALSEQSTKAEEAAIRESIAASNAATAGWGKRS
jgi:conjugal transfer mating pair stabilization protein TraG